jgi:hypothetical protein
MTESEKLDTPKRKTFRFYMPLTPIREHYSDDGSTILLQTPVRDSDLRMFEVALIGSSHDLLMVRISMFELEEAPPPEDIPKIDAVAELMISMLRIYYDNKIGFAPDSFRYGNLIDENMPPELKVSTTTTRPELNIDRNFLTAALNAPEEFRNIIRLFSDSTYSYTPIQYRYLSLFKILEYAFKHHRRKWSPKLDLLFGHFEKEYLEMDISKKSMKALFIDLRDKCAHIKLGDANYLGIVGIGSRDTELVQKFMPLLMKVVHKFVFEKYRVEGTEIRPTNLW